MYHEGDNNGAFCIPGALTTLEAQKKNHLVPLTAQHNIAAF